MDDGKDVDLLGADPVDDPITLNDEFPDIVPWTGFGHAPPDSGMVFEHVRGLDEPIDEQLGVVRHVAGDVVKDVVEIGLGDI